MKSITLLFCTVFMLQSSVVAQSRTLTVVGEAEVAEKANTCEFIFVVKKDGSSLQAAYTAAANYLSDIYGRLIRLGIDSSSIQQSRVRVDDKYFSWFTSKKMEATVRTRLKLTDLSLIEPVLNVLSEYKIEFISPLYFSLTDDQQLRNKTYSLALEKAKMTAAAIAQDHNFTLGTIQTVQEIVYGSQRYDSEVYVAYDSPPSKYLSRSFIAQFPEQITLKKELRVTFEIVNK